MMAYMKKAIPFKESLLNIMLYLIRLFPTYRPLNVKPMEKGRITGPAPSFNKGVKA